MRLEYYLRLVQISHTIHTFARWVFIPSVLCTIVLLYQGVKPLLHTSHGPVQASAAQHAHIHLAGGNLIMYLLVIDVAAWFIGRLSGRSLAHGVRTSILFSDARSVKMWSPKQADAYMRTYKKYRNSN